VGTNQGNKAPVKGFIWS